MTRPRSTFVAMSCSRTGARGVARFEFQEPATWQLAEVRIREMPASATASRPDDLRGAFVVSATYAGCPECGAGTFVRCGACGQLSCYKPDDGLFSCAWCKNTGPVAGEITSVSRID